MAFSSSCQRKGWWRSHCFLENGPQLQLHSLLHCLPASYYLTCTYWPADTKNSGSSWQKAAMFHSLNAIGRCCLPGPSTGARAVCLSVTLWQRAYQHQVRQLCLVPAGRRGALRQSRCTPAGQRAWPSLRMSGCWLHWS